MLRQTIYALRRTLGTDDALLGISHLSLNAAVIETDANEFETMAGAGDYEGALSRYTGPFFDGVHLRASSEFEKWVDGQRLTLETLHRTTWAAHAAELERNATLDAAATKWENFAISYPTDSIAAAGLLRVRLQQGNRAEAIRFGRLHERTLHEELGVAPSEEVQRLLGRTVQNQELPERPFQSVGEAATSRNTEKIAQGEAGAVQFTPPAMDRRPSRATRRVILTAAVVTGVSLLTLLGRTVQAWKEVPAGSVATVAVLPFDLSGAAASGVQDLPRGVVTLLSAALDGVAGLSVTNVDAVSRAATAVRTEGRMDSLAAVARRLGADLFVHGGIVAEGDSIVLVGALHESRNGKRVAVAEERGPITAFLQLTDDVSKSLLAQRFGARFVDHLAGVAARGTSSLAAYRAYLSAESEFKTGKYAAAVEGYRRALGIDSTFAIAHYRLSIAADWVGDGELMLSAARAAVNHASRLGPRERVLVIANHDWRRGAIDAAEQGYRELVRNYPDDAAAWYELGEVQFHSSPLRGRPISASERSFARALALDTNNIPAIEHLAMVSAAYGHTTRAESLLAVAIRRRPPGSAGNQRALVVVLQGDTNRILSLIDSARMEPSISPFVLSPQLATFAHRLDLAERLASSASTRRPVDEGVEAAIMTADFMAAQGKTRRAVSRVRTVASDLKATWSPGVLAFMATRPGVVMTDTEISNVLSELRSWSRRASRDSANQNDILFRSARYASYLEGLLAVAANDFEGARKAAAQLEVIRGDSTARELALVLAMGVRAHLAMAEGRPADALVLLDKAEVNIWLYGNGPATTFLSERYLRGQALEALGRDEEALRWYESCGQRAQYEATCIAPSLLARARIHDRRGEANRARELYAKLLTIWREVDPPLQARRDSAYARLRAIENDK